MDGMSRESINDPSLRRSLQLASLLLFLLIGFVGSYWWQFNQGFNAATEPMVSWLGVRPTGMLFGASCLLIWLVVIVGQSRRQWCAGLLLIAGVLAIVAMQLQAKSFVQQPFPTFVQWHFIALALLLFVGLMGWVKCLQLFWHRRWSIGQRYAKLLLRYWQGLLLLWLLNAVAITQPASTFGI